MERQENYVVKVKFDRGRFEEMRKKGLNKTVTVNGDTDTIFGEIFASSFNSETEVYTAYIKDSINIWFCLLRDVTVLPVLSNVEGKEYQLTLYFGYKLCEFKGIYREEDLVELELKEFVEPEMQEVIEEIVEEEAEEEKTIEEKAEEILEFTNNNKLALTLKVTSAAIIGRPVEGPSREFEFVNLLPNRTMDGLKKVISKMPYTVGYKEFIKKEIELGDFGMINILSVVKLEDELAEYLEQKLSRAGNYVGTRTEASYVYTER